MCELYIITEMVKEWSLLLCENPDKDGALGSW